MRSKVLCGWNWSLAVRNSAIEGECQGLRYSCAKDSSGLLGLSFPRPKRSPLPLLCAALKLRLRSLESERKAADHSADAVLVA